MNNSKYISLILLLSIGTVQPAWDLPSVKTMIPWIGFAGALYWGFLNQQRVAKRDKIIATKEQELGTIQEKARQYKEAQDILDTLEKNGLTQSIIDKKCGFISVKNIYTYWVDTKNHYFNADHFEEGEEIKLVYTIDGKTVSLKVTKQNGVIEDNFILYRFMRV